MTEASRIKTKQIAIAHAEMDDLERLLPLFDAYRVGLGKTTAVGACRTFLFNRLIDEDALILLAFDGEQKAVDLDPDEHQLLGFLQLFPSFSTLALNDIWILNDLYVLPEARRMGVAKKLIEHARDFLTQRWDHGLVLEASQNNPEAQALCEALGFKKDKAVDHYQLLFS